MGDFGKKKKSKKKKHNYSRNIFGKINAHKGQI